MGTQRRPGNRALSWAALLVIAAALFALAFEAAALGWYALREGQLFYVAERHAAADASASAGERRGGVVHQIHPYFGYAVRPGVPIRRFVERDDARRLARVPGPASDWLELRSNNFGFYEDDDYPAARDDAFVVGVFGGSVAHSFAMRGGPLLAERMAGLPRVAGREVAVLNFASGGYKQPQQTLVLAYFLALGQRFDLVLNVDGFNEIALGGVNAARGLDSSFPTTQIMDDLRALTRPEADLAAIRRLADLATLREDLEAVEARRSARRFAAPYLLDELRLRRLRARQATLSEPAPGADDSGAKLFFRPQRSGGVDPSRTVEEWGRASELMAALAASAGAHYLHVLQPNQYASERSFTPAERRVAQNPRSPFARHAPRAYPLLRDRGASLREGGVDFHDASEIFDVVAEPIYVDDCCHYNQHGYELLAEFIASRLAGDPSR